MALLGSLTSGVSALQAFARGIEVIGNNVANVNTTAYKGSSAQYADSFSNVLQGSSPSVGNLSDTSAMQIGTGVELSAVKVNYGQGTLAATGVSTDLGIAGNGYFIVHDVASNTDYATRAGDFRLDDNGYLVTSDGMFVQGINDGAADYTLVAGVNTFNAAPLTAANTIGNIRIAVDTTSAAANVTASSGTLPAGLDIKSFAIDSYGNINISLTDGNSFVAGKVLLQNFRDESALMKEGGNLYSGLGTANPTSGSLAMTLADNAAGTNGLGITKSNSLELSNVDLSSEFANLITAQRSFQAGSRIITVSDTILEEICNLKR